MDPLHRPSPPQSATASRELAEFARSAGVRRDAAEAGTRPAPLLGRHIALVCADARCASAFTMAAEGLGARVSRLPSDAVALTGGPSSTAEARMLGKLYDAVAFGDLAPDAATWLQRASGVPVFSIAPPAPLLADVLTMRSGACTREDAASLCVFQAWLLRALGA